VEVLKITKHEGLILQLPVLDIPSTVKWPPRIM
jgi:hypothetical protein